MVVLEINSIKSNCTSKEKWELSNVNITNKMGYKKWLQDWYDYSKSDCKIIRTNTDYIAWLQRKSMHIVKSKYSFISNLIS